VVRRIAEFFRQDSSVHPLAGPNFLKRAAASSGKRSNV
jgi:hypothetical protein